MFLILILLGLFFIGLALVVLSFLFFKRPLALEAFFSRLALRTAGLKKHRIEGLEGSLVFFEGGRHEERSIVLVHGAGDQAGSWAKILKPLLRKYHVIVPDLFGHGQSQPSKGPIEMGKLLSALERVVDAVGGDRPLVLVGNSLGAWLAFLFARVRPDHVERIIAINGGPMRQNAVGVNLLPADREEARITMQGLMAPGGRPIPSWVLDDIVRRNRTGPVARIAAAAATIAPYLLDDRLKEVTTPVDLVWGQADQLFPIEYAEKLRDGLPAARLKIIPACGHVPQRECPQKVVEALMEILDQEVPHQGSRSSRKDEESS